MYLHEADQVSRYDELQPLLLNEVANVDDVFAMSAQKTDGGRRVRWVHNSSCAPMILEVAVPDGALGPDFDQTMAALESQGYDKPDRKYLAFADANEFCGIGSMWLDDSPTENFNDGGGTSHSRVDAACWSGETSTPAHELLHNLGGVQEFAPNATPYGHCTDESDLMCYEDGSGVPMRLEVCAADQEPLLDCKNDDYFTTREVAGSYLAIRWNTADSGFLDVVPALVQMTQSRTSAQTGDLVTFTVASDTGVGFAWSASNAACIEGATNQSRFTLRCPSTATETITATVTITSSTGSRTTVSKSVTITKAAAPTVTVSPSSARAGTTFTLNATPAGKAPFTYAWSASDCTLSSDTVEDPSVTCPESLAGQTESFTLTVTQADGQSVTRSAPVALVGPLTLTVSGATSMDPDESNLVTATPSRAASVAWELLDPAAACRLSADTGASTALTCEPSYAGGNVTVRAIATSSDGDTASADHIVTIAPVLALNLAGERSTMRAGERTSFTATVNKEASVTWSLESAPTACHLEHTTSAATSSETHNSVFCTADYTGGQLSVRATATESDSDTATATRTLTVSSAPHATSWTTTTATTGHPTALRARLRDGVTGTTLASAPVSAEVRWYGTRVWRTVKTGLSTNQNGVVAYSFGTKRAGYFRFAYAGSHTLIASAAPSVFVRVPTKLSNMVRTGRPNVFRGKLTTTAGAAIGSAKVTLQRRYAGTSRWRNVATATSSRYGNVTATHSPGRKTYYRWWYAGSTTNRAAISRTVSVRR